MTCDFICEIQVSFNQGVYFNELIKNHKTSGKTK